VSEKSELSCDGCGAKDINYTGNSVDYYIALGNQRCSPWFAKDGKTGGMVTDMMIYPPIKGGAKHFCGVGCLSKWVAAVLPEQRHSAAHGQESQEKK
jgi:hypothetical protein